MSELRYIVRQTDGMPLRTDHTINKRHVFSPARSAGEGAPPPYAVLYLGGLLRDLVEGLEGYRYGTDFATHDYLDQERALRGAAMFAHDWTNRDAFTYDHGRQEHHDEDLDFWLTHNGRLPRFFPTLIAGVNHTMQPQEPGLLPFDQLDEYSQRFIAYHFRTIESMVVPLLQSDA